MIASHFPVSVMEDTNGGQDHFSLVYTYSFVLHSLVFVSTSDTRNKLLPLSLFPTIFQRGVLHIYTF